MYIHRELVVKKILPSLSLSSFLEDGISRVHLVIGGWYLEYSCGFTLDVEKPLYNNLVCYGLKVIEQEEEPEKYHNPIPPNRKKKIAPVKVKGK